MINRDFKTIMITCGLLLMRVAVNYCEWPLANKMCIVKFPQNWLTAHKNTELMALCMINGDTKMLYASLTS